MKVSGICRLAVSSLFLICAVAAVAAPPASGYHLIKKVPLGKAPGGAEYFDYITVDAEARRIYVSHGSEYKILDADNFNVLGTVSGLKRCHGIALVPELNKGFITDGEAATVVVIDLKTFKKTGEIKSAPDTDFILYDPASKLVFTFNGDSKNSTVIDPTKDSVVKMLDLGGAPEQAVADGTGLIYDNIAETNEVAVIDTKALTVKARWKVAPAGEPVAMALDKEHGRVFSAGRGPAMQVMMDTESGKVLQSLAISDGVDTNVFDADSGTLFTSTRSGKVHIFHEDSADKLSQVEVLTTEYGAKTMGMDPKTHNLFLSTSDFGPAAGPKGRRPAISGTAHLLVYGK